MRDYLVFARVGPGSLHPVWFADDPDRNWDCCLSWYSAPPETCGAEYVVTGGLNKFDAFFEFRQSFTEPFHYKYILITDNDIAFEPGDISRYFNLCTQYQLYLSAPSLRWGTNINFDVTMNNPACLVRQVSFVEVMAPCFSAAALERLLPTFLLTGSTWGIDYVWSSQLRNENSISIVDAVQIDHTQAPSVSSGKFYLMLKEQGIDAEQELGKIKLEYPSFGGFRTLSRGHVLKVAVPSLLGTLIVKIVESIKRKVRRRAQRKAKQQ